MIAHSLADWFIEREQKMKPLIFVAEWVFIFICSLIACTVFLLLLNRLAGSENVMTASSALFACVIVYLRLFRATGCVKCGSPLPWVREEIDRKQIGHGQKVLELGRSWSQGPAGIVDVYAKNCRVEKVRYRCRKCRGEWAEEHQISTSTYQFRYSIDLHDQS